MGWTALTGVLARDAAGTCYNIEIQVRRYDAWGRRGLYYLTRVLVQQLGAGEDYEELGTVVGIHLLDFDLFEDGAAQQNQALWRFEMRDATQPEVTLGNVLQLNLIELKKADRLGLTAGPLCAWVTFFEHWREEAIMAQVEHPPIQEAMNRVRALSADEQARRLAFVRERALHDEVTLLNEAQRRGEQIGLEKGQQIGLEKGRREAARQTARSLIQLGVLGDEQIAQVTGLSLEQVEALRAGDRR
ncbi:MAG: Rpn family recombination-promoting nuclease/putative transposase [Thiocapsa sp.]|nr:MAG: Rpn family recombination-promoting nuclease/putative transposase [Thiocapsa sp.]